MDDEARNNKFHCVEGQGKEYYDWLLWITRVENIGLLEVDAREIKTEWVVRLLQE